MRIAAQTPTVGWKPNAISDVERLHRVLCAMEVGRCLIH